MQAEDVLPKIIYSCYHNVSREGEQFVPQHVFSYQVSGSLTVNDGDKSYQFHEGEFRFSCRNQLAKFVKRPPEGGGEFKCISVVLDQNTLRKISTETNTVAKNNHDSDPILEIETHPLLTNYIASLAPYLDLPQSENEELLDLKIKEAVLLLLKVRPDLKSILFDFSEPGKIDLEQFMQNNYQFNVTVDRFAYLTGRSLSTFKRDFERTFGMSPSRWLLQKRLKEAYHQIKEKGKTSTEVYLEVGFEDLSHFSFAFKKAFGLAPSEVGAHK